MPFAALRKQLQTAIILQSIDFVGLNRLIGRWQHPKAGVTFKTFSDVSIYSNGEPIKAYGDFKYAITPGTGDNWNFFLTDENQVVLSSLSIREPNLAVMTFYDSKSGAVTGTLPLNRVKR